LHRFARRGVFDLNAELFLCPWDVEEGDDDGVPAKDVRLDETLAGPGDVLRYCYDYGDSWDLAIKLGRFWSRRPGTGRGVRRRPPSRSTGGLRRTRTAEDLAEVLDDPAHFDLGDQPGSTNPFVRLLDAGLDRLHYLLLRLRGTDIGDELVGRTWALTQRDQTVSSDQRAAALRPFLWFLDPPAITAWSAPAAGCPEAPRRHRRSRRCPRMRGLDRRQEPRDRHVPVLAFRELLQRLGLVRKYQGRLVLTRAGASARGNLTGCGNTLPIASRSAGTRTWTFRPDHGVGLAASAPAQPCL
jgi:hypothetical protein